MRLSEVRFCPRSVTHGLRSALPFVTHDRATLVTKAVILRPPRVAQRHHVDYAFHCSELQSVDFTAASWHEHDSAAVDATAAGLSECELTAVETPQVVPRFPSRKGP